MGLPASVHSQLIPVSSATNTLNTTTAEIAIPANATAVSVWCATSTAMYVAVNDGTDIDCGVSNSAIVPATPATFIVLNRNRSTNASVHVERAAGSDGTYYVSFWK